MMGRTKSVWVEGEGMLHALYFKRKNDGCYTIFYNNRYVQTVTYNLEKQSTNPLFLPAVKGDSLAVMCSMLLNWVSIFLIMHMYQKQFNFYIMHACKIYYFYS